MSNEPHLVAFEHQTSQASCRIGASVDIDAVWSNIRLYDRVVPMHHDLAEILLVQEKIFSDPEQVWLTLQLQWNSGADPGMDKEKIPACERQRETLKEAAVASGRSVSALKVATHRAIKSLRKRMRQSSETP